MKKLYFTAEIYQDEKKKDNLNFDYAWRDQSKLYTDRDAAVGSARAKATKHVGDTYGVFELTGTVIHPIPELDVTPVA